MKSYINNIISFVNVYAARYLAALMIVAGSLVAMFGLWNFSMLLTIFLAIPVMFIIPQNMGNLAVNLCRKAINHFSGNCKS